MRFTKEEIEAIEEWREDVIGRIRVEISDTLDSETTTLEQDRALAQTIFNTLLEGEYLAMPEGKQPTAAGGYIPRIPEGAVVGR
jgi:hypothetical protein